MAPKNEQPRPPQPVVCDDLPAAGGTYHGTPVRRWTYLLADGRRGSVELPMPAAPGGGPYLTPGKQRIMDVLRASPGPMTRLAVAMKLGKEDAKGEFGLDFTSLLNVERLLYKHGSEYTDDPRKLPRDDD